MIVNKNIPAINSISHDYYWLLTVTENRKCKEIEPVVKRHVNGKNLSLDPKYREEDFNLMMAYLSIHKEYEGMKRLCATRAKYFYKMQKYRQARKYFLGADFNAKNIMYMITSFFPPIARWIVKKYIVFG